MSTLIYVVTRIGPARDGRPWSALNFPMAYRTRGYAKAVMGGAQEMVVHAFVREFRQKYAKYFDGDSRLDEDALVRDKLVLLREALECGFVHPVELWQVHEVVLQDG